MSQNDSSTVFECYRTLASFSLWIKLKTKENTETKDEMQGHMESQSRELGKKENRLRGKEPDSSSGRLLVRAGEIWS